ncbi:MAG: lipoate-protein ligase [Chloroflexi bacterium]|nr:lipoate-protein ligase [Chloroflexota bacterium]
MPKLANPTLPGPPAENVISLRIKTLGRVPYDEALAEQHRLHAARLMETGTDTLLLLEHPHVYTLGRNSDPRHVLVSEAFLQERGATIAHNERGGEVTYHGPGQVVAYPIILLRAHERSITLLVQRMETAIVQTLADFDIEGSPLPGDHGVWVDGRKIASIGMAVRRWIVLHGMALNVDPDLRYFGYINPCGHAGMPITSMARELGAAPDQREVAMAFARNFAGVFGRVASSLE